MKHKKVKFSVLLLLGICLTVLQAQETIPASGGNASGSGGSASYTVGQVVYTTNKGTTGSVMQGVQQAFEISTVTGLKVASGITLQCSVHPNPTSDFILLKIDGEVQSQYIASLYDVKGKLLRNLKIKSNETSIGMSQFSPGTYFLNIVRAQNSVLQREIKTFKIIKK